MCTSGPYCYTFSARCPLLSCCRAKPTSCNQHAVLLATWQSCIWEHLIIRIYKIDHHTVNQVTLEVTAMQVLEKLDCNDSTVQHVVLASIPPQQPAASTPEVSSSSLPCIHHTHHHFVHVCFPTITSPLPQLDRYASYITLYLALPACLSFIVNTTS